MPPFGRTPSSRNCGFRKYTVSAVPSARFALVEPLPRSHSAICVSSYTIVPPRGVICANPLGSTLPMRHTFAGNAVLMCDCRIVGIFAIVESSRKLGPLVEGRSHIAGRRAAQIAGLALVERPAAVHRAAIIPDHQVAGAPDMPVDKPTLGRELDQIAQQQAAFRHRHADNVRGMCGKVERLALGARMDTDDPLRHRGQYLALAEQQFGESD